MSTCDIPPTGPPPTLEMENPLLNILGVEDGNGFLEMINWRDSYAQTGQFSPFHLVEWLFAPY